MQRDEPAARSFDPSSRARLNPASAARFGSDSLFDRVARVMCEASCLPRKELYESWEVARRTRRRFRGGRVVDLACGHALVAPLLLLLDDTSPEALAVDRVLPPSARRVTRAMREAWPRLAGRVRLEERPLDEVPLTSRDLVVATHACGALTDRVLARAVAARARVVVLPCCHDAAVSDTGGLEGWIDAPLAIDVTRARKLAAAGYEVRTQHVPETITAKNRLLLGAPAGAP
jgi:Methyltransferase domain